MDRREESIRHSEDKLLVNISQLPAELRLMIYQMACEPTVVPFDDQPPHQNGAGLRGVCSEARMVESRAGHTFAFEGPFGTSWMDPVNDIFLTTFFEFPLTRWVSSPLRSLTPIRKAISLEHTRDPAAPRRHISWLFMPMSPTGIRIPILAEVPALEECTFVYSRVDPEYWVRAHGAVSGLPGFKGQWSGFRLFPEQKRVEFTPLRLGDVKPVVDAVPGAPRPAEECTIVKLWVVRDGQTQPDEEEHYRWREVVYHEIPELDNTAPNPDYLDVESVDLHVEAEDERDEMEEKIIRLLWETTVSAVGATPKWPRRRGWTVTEEE